MDVKAVQLSDLITRAKSGDREAFDMLYRNYVMPLHRYVFIRVRNAQDTEDIVQETFLKAYQAIARYEHERESMLPYLFTIARNLLINQRKKKRPDVYLPEDIDRFSSSELASKEATDNELSRDLRAAMAVLTETERAVIELRFFGERTYAEIAGVMGKREDAIRQHVARAMKKMKNIMSQLKDTSVGD